MAITMNGRKQIRTTLKDNHNFNGEITIEKFIELHPSFIRDKQLENLSDKTIFDHENVFKMFVKWMDNSTWSRSDHYVQKALFLDYKDYMLNEKNYAPCTINVRLRPLKTYINWLHEHEYIKTNLNGVIKLVKVADDRVRPLSKADVTKLIRTIGTGTYARFRDMTLTLVILDCGIRIGELLQLTIKDIDFKNGFIKVPAKVSKTRTERILPLSKKSLELLDQLKDIAIEQNQEDLFLSTTGNSKIKEQDIFINFRRYRKEGNITVKCTPYVLRHTFATEMVKRGVDIFTLQRIMGHTQITTTRQYIYLDNDDLIKKHKESNILSHFLE